jgi:hypothetical protein
VRIPFGELLALFRERQRAHAADEEGRRSAAHERHGAPV